MRRIGYALGAVVLLLLQTSCYLSRAALEQARILSARRPIAELVRDRRVPVATHAKLQLVLQARDFAQRELGLDAKESFTAFTQLARDTLVLVVTAAQADAMRPHTWWFPIVGTIPYKGYFDFAAGRREAEASAPEGSTSTSGRQTHTAPSAGSTTPSCHRRSRGTASSW